MIEYIYDAIKAVAGQDTTITAIVKDDEGNCIEANCMFMLHDPDGQPIFSCRGTLEEDIWYFNMPASATEGRKGRHWYCIGADGSNLCFLKPFYLD